MAAAVADVLRGGPGAIALGFGDDDFRYTGRYQIPSLTSVITLVCAGDPALTGSPESQAGWTRVAQRAAVPRLDRGRTAPLTRLPARSRWLPTLSKSAGYPRSEAWQNPGRSVPQPARAGCA